MVSVILAVLVMAATAEHEPLSALGYWMVLGAIYEWSKVVERREKKRGEL